MQKKMEILAINKKDKTMYELYIDINEYCRIKIKEAYEFPKGSKKGYPIKFDKIDLHKILNKDWELSLKWMTWYEEDAFLKKILSCLLKK